MNYSRDKIEQEYERLHSKVGPILKKLRAYLMRGLFFLIIAAVVVGVCGGLGVVKGVIADSPDVSSVNIAPSGYATIIYDANGREMQKLVSSNANRMAVSIDKVPQILQDAVVAIEDERFYEHNGIDPRGIARATVYMIRSRFRSTQGASTITQQLLKNNVFTEWTEEKTLGESIKRKIQEQYLAVQLEKRLNNKKLILENYLNTINLGAGTYGVEAAAKRYFNKDVWELTLSESAVIAGITQNPYRYNPIRHPEDNAYRRDLVLDKMVELGYITQEEADEARADNVYERIEEAQTTLEQQDTVYSYFVDELTEQVVEDLIEAKGYTETQAYQALYSGGLRIFTTQDTDIQRICDEEFQNESNYPNKTQYELDWALSIQTAEGEVVNYSREMLQSWFREKTGNEKYGLKYNSTEEAAEAVETYKESFLKDSDTILAERTNFTPQPQASMAVIDQQTGYVKAIVGGRGKKTASLTLNRATNTYRQPGSTFKIPLYAAAIDNGNATLATAYKDEAYNYASGRAVHNWLTDHYLGYVTIREAIINSINIPAVKCITQITPQTAYNKMLEFGFTTLSEQNDIYQSLALGGIYNGVSTLELTAAYATVANGGIYIKPIFYTKILDQYGNVILDNTPEQSRVIKETTSFLLTDAMRDVMTKGTGMASLLSDMPCAGKTGTTQDYRNVWFAGFTPYYTCAVWTGYDNNESLPGDGSYHDYSQKLWHAIMERIHSGLAYREFMMPSGITEATVCEVTGQLATSACPKKITEYFSVDTVPHATCEKHSAGTVDIEDYSLYRGYGEGGNGDEPGAYALGINDLDKYDLADAEGMYNSYLAQLYARLRALEEARRKAEEERKRQEEAAAAAAAAAAQAAAQAQQQALQEQQQQQQQQQEAPPDNGGGGGGEDGG